MNTTTEVDRRQETGVSEKGEQPVLATAVVQMPHLTDRTQSDPDVRLATSKVRKWPKAPTDRNLQ